MNRRGKALGAASQGQENVSLRGVCRDNHHADRMVVAFNRTKGEPAHSAIRLSLTKRDLEALTDMIASVGSEVPSDDA